MENQLKKLNLGCGNDYKPGWINVDKGSCKRDVAWDIEVFPWPFEDSSVEIVLLKHMLEHISPTNFIPFLNELYRVCKSGAQIEIEAPHAGSNNYWTDPTHKMPLTVRTFDFFDSSKPLYENGLIYGWNNIKFSVVRAEVVDNPPNGPDVYYLLKVVK